MSPTQVSFFHLLKRESPLGLLFPDGDGWHLLARFGITERGQEEKEMYSYVNATLKYVGWPVPHSILSFFWGRVLDLSPL